VALLHHLSHGTASRYAPLLAGPDLAYTLLSTPCRGFLAAQALADPDSLTACLDFRRAFQASGARRIAPVAGTPRSLDALYPSSADVRSEEYPGGHYRPGTYDGLVGVCCPA
jgi:hypothetical protein